MFFITAKQGENAIWRYLVGLVLVILGLLIGQMPLGIAMWVGSNKATKEYGAVQAEEMMQNMDFVGLGIGNNLALFLLILSFGVGIICLWFALKFIHERSFKSIISPNQNVDYRKIFFGFFLWFGLTVVAEAINFTMNAEDYQFNLDWSKFIPLILISFLLLPIQTSFEELFTRGYLMQGLGLVFKNKWVPLIITSSVFALLHIFNPEVQQYGKVLMMIYYISAGLVLGLLTIWDDSLELALGVHAATNVYAAVFVSYEGSALQTDALFKTAEVDMSSSLFLLLGISIIFIVICAIKYQWKNLMGNLFRPIPFPARQATTNYIESNFISEEE